MPCVVHYNKTINNLYSFHSFRLVHSECDDKIDAALLLQMKNEEPTDYLCTICRNRDPEVCILSDKTYELYA